MLFRALNVAALLLMPFVLAGIVQRVKSLWSGRKGPPVLQLAFDVRRLVQKSAVYSETTTAVFRCAPYVACISAFAAAAITPLLGGAPCVSFRFDFVWLAYTWALGRAALMLAALDTGSPFAGMGAAREATFSAVLEPIVFLVFGALCLLSGAHTLHEALALRLHDGPAWVGWIAVIVAWFIVLQVEAGRMPVDDPSTHLELTMVHEAMVLDHSGVELAAIQMASAVKLFVGCAVLATLINPWAGTDSWRAVAANLVGCVFAAIAIGHVEVLSARVKLRAVPSYIVVALVSAVVALLAAAWRAEGVG